jgi:magnesium-transporting ATPase (P-type)
MKNKLFSRNSKFIPLIEFIPLIALIALSVMQFLYTQQSLQRYQEYADQNYGTLDKLMFSDNVPSNIKEHIIYVQNQSTFNTSLLANSLSFTQLFMQFNIFLVFWIFYSQKKRKTGEESEE